MTDTPQLVLAHHLKALKLPTFLREYDKLARQCAAEDLDHIRFLLRLAELELIDRERRMVERRIKEARFPAVKSLNSFDFAEWTSAFGSERLTGACSTGLTHHVHILQMNGYSYRLNQSKRRSHRASSGYVCR